AEPCPFRRDRFTVSRNDQSAPPGGVRLNGAGGFSSRRRFGILEGRRDRLTDRAPAMSEHLRLPRGLPDEAYDLGEPTDEVSIGAGRPAAKLVLGLVCLLAGLGLAVLQVVLFVGVQPGQGGGFRGGFYLIFGAIMLIAAGIGIPIRVL